jgi:multidrug resistance protein, MATE family
MQQQWLYLKRQQKLMSNSSMVQKVLCPLMSAGERKPLLNAIPNSTLTRATSALNFAKPAARDGFMTIGDVVRTILSMAWKIAIAMSSWVVMKSTDTAILGHVSSDALEGASLSDLYTSASGVFIQGNVLNVLAGQAVGAGNPKLIGIWLQVSLFTLILVAVPVVILWAVTEPVLLALGARPALATIAGHYALILLLAIPLRIIASQLGQVLQSQKIMMPPVVASVVAMLFNVLVGVPLVLGVPFGVKGVGFYGCPSTTVGAELIQALILGAFVFGRHLYQPWWPGWSKAHITKKRIWVFLKLYVPAALSLASDFWRVSVIGTIAATYGELDVAVFSASYRILWMTLILTVAFASSMSIALNISFGANQPKNAKLIVTVGILLILATLTVLGTAVYIATSAGLTGQIFSQDPEILALFRATALPMTIVTVFMPLSVALEKIPLSMGRSRVVLFFGLIGSWALQVPLAFCFTHYLEFETPIFRLFLGVGLGYVGVCILLLIYIFTCDFASAARDAVANAEKPAALATTINDDAPDELN